MDNRNQFEEENGGFPFGGGESVSRRAFYPSLLGDFTFGVIIVGLFLVLLRSASMQLLERDYWIMTQAEAQSRASHGQEKRGRLLDRYGQPLAMDRDFYKIAIDPDQLSRLFRSDGDGDPVPLKISVTDLLQKLEDAGVQFWKKTDQLEQALLKDVKNNLLFRSDPKKGERKRYRSLGNLAEGTSPETLEKVIQQIERDLEKKVFPGLEMEVKRHYPYGETALGVIGEKELRGPNGLWGWELFFNSQLRCMTSRISRQMAPGGKQIAEERQVIPGFSGEDIQMTLDMNLQEEVEHLCLENYQRASARSVSATVVDPFTGEILAYATYPGLKRGELSKLATEDQKNGTNTGMKRAYDMMARSHRVSLEPGSVVKPLILARAIEMGIPLDLALPVHGKNQRLDGRRRIFRDSSLLKEKTPEGAVVFSSNIGMVLLGVKHMKKSDVESILRRFGFGSRTGIELPGEEPGYLKPVDQWSRYSWESACYGYEMMVTPVQVLRSYMAIANGGYLLQPTFLKNKKVTLPPIVLSENVAGECRRVLRRAVTDGTGRHIVHNVSSEMRALIRDGQLEMAGKTGTTKLMDPETGKYTEDRYNSSFVGFAPVENARFLTVVLVEEPTPEGNMYYASKSAAPLGAQILASAMNLPGFDPFAVDYADPRDSESGILADPDSADNLNPLGSQIDTAREIGQEGEPDRW